MNGMLASVIKTCNVFESPISTALAAVCSKAVALLVSIDCLLFLSLFVFLCDWSLFGNAVLFVLSSCISLR